VTDVHNTLESFLIDRIKSKGPMNLGAFLSQAMTNPDFGYYTQRDPLGKDGDFTTAPEISQIFGELIGAWVVDVWMQMGQPEFNLIECGPGKGTLMTDIMRVASKVQYFTDKVHIRLIEARSVLRITQGENLSAYDVTWYDELSEVKRDMPCIIIGNEFLDALPIEQLKRGENGWQKRILTVSKDDKLSFKWADAEDDLTAYLPSKTESGETYEVSPARVGFTKECAALIKEVKGAALMIDYGHTQSHHGDTLQAIRAHKYSNILDDIGQSDITSHIDFDALLKAFQGQGVSQMPCVTQRHFLMTLGIDIRANALSKANPDRGNAINEDVERLIGREQMGELFKVMCFYSGGITPCGFE